MIARVRDARASSVPSPGDALKNFTKILMNSLPLPANPLGSVWVGRASIVWRKQHATALDLVPPPAGVGGPRARCPRHRPRPIGAEDADVAPIGRPPLSGIQRASLHDRGLFAAFPRS